MDEGGAGGPPFGSRVLLGQAYQAGWDAVACLLQEGALRPGSAHVCVDLENLFFRFTILGLTQSEQALWESLETR